MLDFWLIVGLGGGQLVLLIGILVWEKYEKKDYKQIYVIICYIKLLELVEVLMRMIE